MPHSSSRAQPGSLGPRLSPGVGDYRVKALLPMNVNDLLSPLLDALFPPRCLHCHRAGGVLCEACLASAERPRAPLCERCGQQLTPTSDATLCSACLAEPEPVAIEMSRAVAYHEGVIREAVLALKYQRRRRVAEPLGDLLAAWLLDAGWQVDTIVPVPLHVNRRQGRGFNQAELIARRCARRLGVPCTSDLLRARETPPQVGLTAMERRENVAGAFSLSRQEPSTSLMGKRVLLVDDVTTTGSTLRAAAEALQGARPLSIRAICVSRPRFDDNADLALAQRPASRRPGARP